MTKLSGGTLLALIFLGQSSFALADPEDMQQLATLFPDGRNLVQLSYTQVDSAEAKTEIWLPNYTYAYSRNLRLSFTAGVSTASDFDTLQGAPEAEDSVF